MAAPGGGAFDGLAEARARVVSLGSGADEPLLDGLLSGVSYFRS
jgi:hypothetical protein